MKVKILHPSLVLKGVMGFLLFLLPLAGAAQDTLKNNTYQVWLRSQHQRKPAMGYLRNLSDSTMTLCTSRYRADTGLRVYPVEQVQWVKVRERQSIVRGIGRGALFGFAVGFVYGLLQGDNSPCKESGICIRFSPLQSGLIYSVVTTPIGAVAGGILGSFKTKITIGGSRSEYARQRAELEKHRLRQ